jgi:ABC-type branched-subunit amino acid transport system ATPase component
VSVPILEVVNVHAAYGRIEVLRGIDLTVPKGAVVALLGPNGAGKSTLLKVISGQMEQTSGIVVRPNRDKSSGFAPVTCTPARWMSPEVCSI